MDHLPPVVNACKPIVVPYYGYPYEHGGFTDFPTPQDISLAALEDRDSPLKSIQGAAPFLQARFVFGLLSEVLGMPINRSDFIKVENGRQLLTTAKLPDYLKRWRANKEQNDAQDSSRFCTDRITEVLNLSCTTWQSIPQFAAIVQPEVELSIQLIARALDHAISCVSGVEVGRMSWRRVSNELLYNRMVADGWCPSLVWQLGSFQLTWLYYASLMGPPLVKRDHSKCPREERCQVEQQRTTDEDNASQHVCPDREKCYEVMATDSEAIANAVREGGIPLCDITMASCMSASTKKGHSTRQSLTFGQMD